MKESTDIAEKEKTHKVIYIEFMRLIACFLVIVNHTVGPIYRDRGPSLTWLFGITYFFVCKIAVPLFLIIMGAILLKKMDTAQKAGNRILRSGAVLVAVSAIYYAYWGIKSNKSISLLNFLQTVLRTQTTNALWYLYLYLGILCLLPILQKMVKAISKRDLQWLLFLSIGISGTIPLIRIFIPSFGVSGYFTGVLFSPYLGLVLWGYYIEQCVTVDRTKNFFAVLSFVLFIVFQVVATYYLYQKDSSKYLLLDNRIFITITGSAMAFYVTIKYLFSTFTLGPRVSNTITRLGGLTFGIYLLSDLIIDLTKPVYAMLCAHIHVILAMGLWELLIFSICAMLAAALKQIPGLKKWI